MVMDDLLLERLIACISEVFDEYRDPRSVPSIYVLVPLKEMPLYIMRSLQIETRTDFDIDGLDDKS